MIRVARSEPVPPPATRDTSDGSICIPAAAHEPPPALPFTAIRSSIPIYWIMHNSQPHGYPSRLTPAEHPPRMSTSNSSASGLLLS